MSIVFSTDPSVPGLHALVIGVGRYPHCGATSTHEELRGVRDLGAPPHSAAAIAKVVVEHFVEGQPFPLRSLQLLMNEPVEIEGWASPSLPDGWVPSPPTFQNIKTAFDQLYAWGDRHRSNALLIFFSGHGVQRTDWTLLTADVGQNAADLLRGAIDISETRRGTYRCAARTQLWLVDACRENASAMASIPNLSGEPLARAQAVDTLELDSTFLASTTEFAMSWGERHAPSRFTKAVVAAIDAGLAAHADEGQWKIATGGIQRAVNSVLTRQREEKPDWPVQQCEPLGGTGAKILLTGVKPRVPTSVTCDPLEYLSNVDLTLKDHDGVTHRRNSHNVPLRVEAAAGMSKISAVPTAAHVTLNEMYSVVIPPETREILKW